MAVARAVKQWLERPGIELSLKLLVIVSLGLGGWATFGQWQLTRCQAAYNEASNRSTAGRAQAAAEDREAVDDLVSSVIRDPANGLEALRGYESTRAAADQRRAENPVPPAPSTRCG